MEIAELAQRLSRLQNVVEAVTHNMRVQRLAGRGSNGLPSNLCFALKAALDDAGMFQFGSQISRYGVHGMRPLVAQELGLEHSHDISAEELLNVMAEMVELGWVLPTSTGSGWVVIMPDEADEADEAAE